MYIFSESKIIEEKICCRKPCSLTCVSCEEYSLSKYLGKSKGRF